MSAMKKKPYEIPEIPISPEYAQLVEEVVRIRAEKGWGSHPSVPTAIGQTALEDSSHATSPELLAMPYEPVDKLVDTRGISYDDAYRFLSDAGDGNNHEDEPVQEVASTKTTPVPKRKRGSSRSPKYDGDSDLDPHWNVPRPPVDEPQREINRRGKALVLEALRAAREASPNVAAESAQQQKEVDK